MLGFPSECEATDAEPGMGQHRLEKPKAGIPDMARWEGREDADNGHHAFVFVL